MVTAFNSQDLLLDRPWKIAEAAERMAQQRGPVPLHKEWIITVYDRFWIPVGTLGDDLIELTGTDPQNNLPTATMRIKYGTELMQHFLTCTDAMVGVTIETGGLRFPFYVDTYDLDYSEDGDWTCTVHLKGIWDILNHLIIWPSWFLPIQTQPISHAVFVYAVCTCIENMVAEQALRIQSGINEFINNAFSLNPDFRAWFGTLLQSNGNIFQMLKTPIYVVRNNPFLDTSPLIARTVRMESCGAVIADVTRSYGVDCRMDLWLPGDEQPDAWANLDQPTYVFTVKDRRQIKGPTHTVSDSIIGTAVDLGGSFAGEVSPIIEQVPGMEGVFFSPVLGQSFVEPYGILIAPDPGHKGSIVSCKISHHTQTGYQHIIGGRSPKWLNDLMNATYAWIIDSVSILIGFTGIPSNLLEGFLNNAFLAFQLIQNYTRRAKAGPYHPGIEVFHATASSPYNIETVFAFINAMWDSRGYASAQVVFRNGEVLTLGKDVARGGLISLLYLGRTRLYTDHITNIMFHLSATKRDVFLQVGDGRAEEGPLAKHQRFITGAFESVNVLTLAPQS